MDKSYIFCDRLFSEYHDGVEDFIEFAILNSKNITLVAIWNFLENVFF